MNPATIIGLVICGVLGTLMIVIIWRGATARKRFLENLHEGQVVKFGENERIGRIISVYMYSVYLVDLQTCEKHTIKKNEIYPL